jgi:hypothetical protein
MRQAQGGTHSPNALESSDCAARYPRLPRLALVIVFGEADPPLGNFVIFVGQMNIRDGFCPRRFRDDCSSQIPIQITPYTSMESFRVSIAEFFGQ